MQLSFRWYGQNDPITLDAIRQIPNVKGIVSAIYDIPVGEVWPRDRIRQLNETIHAKGFESLIIESVPVHESIKLGSDNRDQLIENYCQTLQNLAAEGVTIVTYNFMAVFDWMRTDLNFQLPDGSHALLYDQKHLDQIDLKADNLTLPGWDTSYTSEELQDLLSAYQQMTEDDLWKNLEYFLQKIIPVAREVGIKMAIHPDDPPWSIFGLPRIIKNRTDIQRLLSIVDDSANGLALCSGSFGANPNNNLPAIIREFGSRIHFAHIRNIKHVDPKTFHETAHPTAEGSLDIYDIIKAYIEIGFTGPMRPDHGRMIWDEKGKPGYGLFDRALGLTYLNGLWEGINKTKKTLK
jgi:mannonate dehydratase